MKQVLEVLVVDDDESVRQSVAHLAESLGHKVMTADSPNSAVDMCHLKHFDLLFTDLEMPYMSGIELARKLRTDLTSAEGPRKIVLMTGNQAGAEAARSLVGLFAEVLQKPFEFAAFRKCFCS